MTSNTHISRKGSGRLRHVSEAPVAAAPFKGYTLDELRYKMVVNQLKISVVQDRLLMLVSPKMQRNADTLTGYVSNFSSFMRYFDIAMLAVGVFRKLVSVWRFFFPKRQN